MLTVTLVGMAEKWNWTIGSRNQRGNQVWRQYKLLQQSFTKDWDDELFFFFKGNTTSLWEEGQSQAPRGIPLFHSESTVEVS